VDNQEALFAWDAHVDHAREYFLVVMSDVRSIWDEPAGEVEVFTGDAVDRASASVV
jgi:hypothetical protein